MVMDRRNFFRTMVGGVAVAAAARTFPFRVFSFPNQITRWVGIDWSNDNYVWIMNRDQEAAIQALELESFRKEIPDLLRNESIMYEKIRRNGVICDINRKGQLWTGGTFSAR
jgi:hypothetical protein